MYCAWTFRAQYLTGFLVCVLLLAYAIYQQFELHVEPCPMCIFQRLAFIAMGLAFLVGGNMAIAASGQGGLLVRVDPAHADRLIERSAAEPMVMRGRPMTGWVRVPAEAVRTKAQLTKWVDRGVEYARTLPAKYK